MNDDLPADNDLKPRTLREAFRERLRAKTAMRIDSNERGDAAEHDPSTTSLAREKVTYIEPQRVRAAELAQARKLQALKEHWENSFERFDKLEGSHQQEKSERPADDVERLRENLTERLKCALQSLSQEQSYERGYSR